MNNTRRLVRRTLRTPWFGPLIAALGFGSAVAYLLWDKSTERRAVDDRSLTQAKALQLLRNLRDRAFDADNAKLALALGRPEEELRSWDLGSETIDDDVVMKARGLALHRGVDFE